MRILNNPAADALTEIDQSEEQRSISVSRTAIDCSYHGKIGYISIVPIGHA
jgi:hypothetical protein